MPQKTTSESIFRSYEPSEGSTTVGHQISRYIRLVTENSVSFYFSSGDVNNLTQPAKRANSGDRNGPTGDDWLGLDPLASVLLATNTITNTSPSNDTANLTGTPNTINVGNRSSSLLDLAVGGGPGVGALNNSGHPDGARSSSLLGGELLSGGGVGGGLAPEVLQLQRENQLLQKQVRSCRDCVVELFAVGEEGSSYGEGHER